MSAVTCAMVNQVLRKLLIAGLAAAALLMVAAMIPWFLRS